MKLFPTLPQSEARAVSVSPRLQKWVLGSLAAMELTQVGFVAILYGFNTGDVSTGFVLTYVSITLFPLIAFVLAFFTTPRYGAKINRWFIAALKTVVVTAIFSALQSLKGYSIALLANNGSGQDGSLPPQWITSAVSDYVILTVCLLGFVYSIYRGRKK